jgi:hypothetical protein
MKTIKNYYTSNNTINNNSTINNNNNNNTINNNSLHYGNNEISHTRKIITYIGNFSNNQQNGYGI